MTVYLTNPKQQVMEVLAGLKRRRRWSAKEKMSMVRESFEPGKSVSSMIRPEDWDDGRHARTLHDHDLIEEIERAVVYLPSYGYRRVWGRSTGDPETEPDRASRRD